jgi:hypothetical protein
METARVRYAARRLGGGMAVGVSVNTVQRISRAQ